MKKLTSRKPKTLKRIYLVIYDQQEFMGYDTNIPTKAFKSKKSAEIYASSRNFEFQSICLHDEEEYESYVLDNNYSDFLISISDFRDAHSFIKEEMLRLEKNGRNVNVWEILETITPFKVMPIEYVNELKHT
jgi:hypothetical protein